MAFFEAANFSRAFISSTMNSRPISGSGFGAADDPSPGSSIRMLVLISFSAPSNQDEVGKEGFEGETPKGPAASGVIPCAC